jgi:hypothetical protein
MKVMDNRDFEKFIKSIDTEVTPPDDLKEKLLSKIMSEFTEGAVLSPLERFIFERPIRVACILSVTISGLLWAVLGNDFAKLLNSIIRG